MRLAQLALLAATMSEEEFAKAYPKPCLVFEKLPGGIFGTGSDTPTGEFHWAKTDLADRREKDDDYGMPEAITRETIFFLEKSSRNNFDGLVILGRQPRSDLVLESHLVSKVHLMFMQQPGAAGWNVVDPGSTNGTLLNGKKLSPRAFEPIREADVLVIAREIEAVYHTASGLFRRLSGLHVAS
ncbi:MAG TPA: FHA domain-containing protein [Planctomycetota bacterium]|nr:FHA domain-containing protein [Planctomycetota bacterium]